MSFEEAIAGHNLVFVVGAGVSIGATHGSPTASWKGLVASGIDEMGSLASNVESWQSLCRAMLDQDDPSMLLSAASQVQAKIKAIGSQAYANWLKKTVGRLELKTSETIESIRESGYPILTTNYDTLLEGLTGGPCSWLDAPGMQEILAGESNAIGHIHGVWTQPDSVILSESDYARHAESSAIQEIQRAAKTIKTLVYVGYGSGFDDPNFSAWLEWHRATFPDSRRTHYRLCRSHDLAELRRVHSNDNIELVAYGDEYSDLPTFLKSRLPSRASMALTPAGKVRDSIAEAKLEFHEAMHSQGVVSFPSPQDGEGSVPIIPPPLLPVPYGQYTKQRVSDRGKTRAVERLDSYSVARESGITVVACDEGGGLTTAVRWLALEAAEHVPGATPVYLAFNQCAGGRKTPVEKALRANLRARGIMGNDPLSDLPSISLAIDDVHAYNRTAEAALQEIANLNCGPTFLGCRTGDEDEVVAALRAAGAHPTLRYVGRLETQDVIGLVEQIAPNRSRSLVSQVADAFTRTKLPRTPMAVSTILYILMYGDTLISASASQSSILEQYVEVLLGRGNPLEDARVTIEARGRESVLASLAGRLVTDNIAILPEATVVEHFGEHFKRVGWTESPTKLLDSFVRRGVLRRTPAGVEFQHPSFVFLFAAKRAISHGDFLNLLLERPLYYSRIVQVYAGLARNDSHPLFSLLQVFRSRLSEIGLDPAKSYAPIRQLDAPEESDDSDDDSEENLAVEEGEEQGPDQFTALDYPEPIVPLFNDDVDLPVTAEMGRMLELLSTVLRDADQIEQLDLKRDALRVTLEGWGRFISVLSHSIAFKELVDTLAEELHDDWPRGLEQDRIAEILERILPPAAAMSAIGFALKSRTLISSLEAEIEEGELARDELLVGCAMLLISIGERGWPKRLSTLFAVSRKLSIWADFFVFDLERCFLSSASAEGDRSDALELIVAIRSGRYKFTSVQDEKRFGDKVRDRMRKERLRLESKSRLAIEAGEGF